MIDFFYGIGFELVEMLQYLWSNLHALITFMPLFILLELPLALVVITGIVSWSWQQRQSQQLNISPKVSCIITCYSEGEDIFTTIDSLCEQVYPGVIEIIPVVDGAAVNIATYQAARQAEQRVKRYKNRHLVVLPKWQRGGRVSSCNSGLSIANGEIVMALDGDTSFDNDMVMQIVKQFEDPNVPAVGGALRVRNEGDSLVSRMQSLEYMISIQGSKTGLGQWNVINNISGAFGAFRKTFLRQIGGWDTHTAEDLDLTMRIKQYLRRHPNMRIPFATLAIGHTDAPSTIKELFNQRLRWDGDLWFIFMRKHKQSLNPKLLGWKTFIFTLVYGVIQGAVMPIVVVVFNIIIICLYPIEFILAMFLAQYLFYLMMAVLYYSIFVIAISERPKQDLKKLHWLMLFPLYGLLMKFFTTIAIVNEVIRRGHEETSMAPWWVLKRGKKF